MSRVPTCKLCFIILFPIRQRPACSSKFAPFAVPASWYQQCMVMVFDPGALAGTTKEVRDVATCPGTPAVESQTHIARRTRRLDANATDMPSAHTQRRNPHGLPRSHRHGAHAAPTAVRSLTQRRNPHGAAASRRPAARRRQTEHSNARRRLAAGDTHTRAESPHEAGASRPNPVDRANDRTAAQARWAPAQTLLAAVRSLTQKQNPHRAREFLSGQCRLRRDSRKQARDGRCVGWSPVMRRNTRQADACRPADI
ncbi:hypothetical protein LXA43DRAFT_423877 [Ganoderma leucocontextum]|nr:hypothetical protein LXA43DRAFT_423877 [Ganoderma leucocontextum]